MIKSEMKLMKKIEHLQYEIGNFTCSVVNMMLSNDVNIMKTLYENINESVENIIIQIINLQQT